MGTLAGALELAAHRMDARPDAGAPAPPSARGARIRGTGPRHEQPHAPRGRNGGPRNALRQGQRWWGRGEPREKHARSAPTPVPEADAEPPKAWARLTPPPAAPASAPP
ncbi:hypothetical protein GCM10010289_38060 [Streptomyces violascens]|uniref:Uncharacterized protein n=1 Tax=Streptomyces violascens TaxID=67381 RepID=A0ABQ3QX62_9ACTN|nr:hypothetical protein GCM10010289_38060 [Streptomyces violascens]GHI41856.1 hypothetical protein Sviol_62640 [Streptomyces violascens]